MREVALPVPTTAGSPHSRATLAAWLIEPPMSDTAPAIFWKIGAQVGLVIWHTSMSPWRTREISSTSSAEYRRVRPSVREGLISPFFSYMRRVCGCSFSMSATTPIM